MLEFENKHILVGLMEALDNFPRNE